MAIPEQRVLCSLGEHNYQWCKYCGAQVCVECDDHKGLGRCFCGWPRGEKLEDDIGDARFDGENWEVEY